MLRIHSPRFAREESYGFYDKTQSQNIGIFSPDSVFVDHPATIGSYRVVGKLAWRLIRNGAPHFTPRRRSGLKDNPRERRRIYRLHDRR